MTSRTLRRQQQPDYTLSLCYTLPERKALLALAAQLGVKEPALRKRIERGTLLAIKRGKRVYSHPLLAL